MIEAALFTYLTAVGSGVRDLVSTRVYPMLAAQNGATPFVVYQRIGAERHVTSCGQANLTSAFIQIDSYAREYGDAKALAHAVQERIANFHGTMGSVEVKKAFLTTELDLLDVEPGLYRVSQTYTVWFVE